MFREAFGEDNRKSETKYHLFEVYFDNQILERSGKKNV